MQLKSLDAAALKAQWRAAFKSAPPRVAQREFFVRFLAHEFQARTHGGLRKSSLKTLAGFAELAPAAGMKLHPGTGLLCQRRGVAHEVMVMERGYAYRGRSYTSLSEIARHITGARWSGPRLFGLQSHPERARRSEPRELG